MVSQRGTRKRDDCRKRSVPEELISVSQGSRNIDGCSKGMDSPRWAAFLRKNHDTSTLVIVKHLVFKAFEIHRYLLSICSSFQELDIKDLELGKVVLYTFLGNHELIY